MARQALLAAAFATALSGLSWLLFLPFPRDADMASVALAGLDMAQGNWRLAGWWLPSDNVVTLDLPLYALAGRLGLAPLAAAYVVPAVLWGGTCTLAVLAAMRGRSWIAGWPAACVLACLAVPAMLSPIPGFEVSLAPDHIMTVAVLLLAMLVLDRANGQPGSRAGAYLAGASALLLLAVIGDPMAIFIGALPMFAASALHLRRGIRPRFHVAVCVASVSAVVLAKILVAWNASTGGFTPMGLRFSLSRPERVLPHLLLTARWLAQYLGADIADISWRNPASVLVPLRAPLALLFGWVCLVTARHIARPGADPPAYLDTVLWLALAADIASTALSGLIVDEASSRYVIPAYIFGSILLAGTLTGRIVERAAVSAALACTALVAVAVLARGVPRPAGAPQDIVALAAALDRSGAAVAYAPYGAASLSTALTQGRVPVRALWTGVGGRLKPFPWVTKADFYRAAAAIQVGRIAVIVHDVTPVDAFTQHDVETLMGPPRAQSRSGDYLIDLYDAGGAGQASLVP